MLVAIGIAIALLIELFKSNDLQEWMARCYFGTISNDARYDSFEDELDQFELAMKKLGVKSDGETSEYESPGNAVAHGA